MQRAMLDAAWRASLTRVATSLICVGTIPGAPRPTPKHAWRRAPVEVKQNENPRGSFCPRSSPVLPLAILIPSIKTTQQVGYKVGGANTTSALAHESVHQSTEQR